jgi:predicted translin family RNA/ssDNA-binding protein
MNNDELNQVKTEVQLISREISQMITSINDLAKSMNAIDNEEQPEEFKEAAVLYSQAKNQLTQYLLTVADNLSLVLMGIIEEVQSGPKAKLWTPS